MTRDQQIDNLAVSTTFHPFAWGDAYVSALVDIFGKDWRNGHTLVKARHDVLTAAERARDYPARVALVSAKQERRNG